MNRAEEIATQLVADRRRRINRIALDIVNNREKEIVIPPTSVEVTVPGQQSPTNIVNVPNITVPEISIPATVVNVDVPKQNIEIINEVETPEIPIEINVPKLLPPTVNVKIPKQEKPTVNVKLVVPEDAIKVNVVIPKQEVKDPPKKAVIKHSDGTTSTVKLLDK